MPTKHDYRRQNLRNLADSMGGPTALAKKLGYANSSFIVQMAGPNPIRQVTEHTARRFETLLDLIPGSLDAPVEVDPASMIDPEKILARQNNLYRKRQGLEPLPQALMTVNSTAPVTHGHNPNLMSRDQLASLVSLVGKVCEDQQASLPTNKFADIIALALLAHDDNKPTGDEDYVKLLVSLTK